MLTRLLTNLNDIEACLLSGEGDVMGGEGKGNFVHLDVDKEKVQEVMWVY